MVTTSTQLPGTATKPGGPPSPPSQLRTLPLVGQQRQQVEDAHGAIAIEIGWAILAISARPLWSGLTKRQLSLARVVDGLCQKARGFLVGVEAHRVLRFDKVQ